MDTKNTVKIEDIYDKNLNEVLDMVEFEKHVPIRNQVATINALVGIILEKDEYGLFTYNSVTKDIMAKVAFISLATNIQLLDDDYDNYDILNKTGLLDYIKDYSDFNAFYDMLDKRIRDIMRDNSVEHILAERSNDMIISINRMFRHINKMIDKGDPNKMAKYLSKGIEAIANKLPDLSALDVAEKLKEELNMGIKDNDVNNDIKITEENKDSKEDKVN
ncbi:MAG: hypothetical protein MR695_05670 [Solobacterium sp.]|nr:hypothetical protein [Solobacterium sp.]